MRSVLMVAFHYPPCVGSTGVYRTLKFSRYLPRNGWRPIVLTAHPRAYPKASDEALGEIPNGITVRRAFALNTARHLAIRGAYLRLLALPDPWVTWWFGAVPAGLRLIRRHRPAAIWSTFPVATAHLIGLTLHRLTGIPWVADFRDPMTEEDHPGHGPTRRLYRLIERQIVRHASRLVFTAPSALQWYRERYPQLAAERCVVISNGYDEEDFRDLATPPARVPASGAVRLVHAGLIYTEERDPRAFLHALARLVKDGRVGPDTLRVELRDAGSRDYYAKILRGLGLEEVVHLLPRLSYRVSLRDCAEASALLVLQGPSCNRQIPAKTYEYLRLRKPILALASAAGDTARVLMASGGATIIELLDEDAIYNALPEFLASVRAGAHALPDPTSTLRYARHNQALDLAKCLSSAA